LLPLFEVSISARTEIFEVGSIKFISIKIFQF
jgi:hypothetical protein